jgi:hypothetical protein
MTDAAQARPRHPIWIAIPGFALSVALTSACYAAAGASLGLYFGGTLLATIVAPPVVLAHETLARRAFAYAGVVDGVGLVWLIAALRSETTLGDWLACYVLLAAYVLALAGLALLMLRLRAGAIAASATAVVAGLLWLTWPVWLSPWLSGDRGAAIVAWLAPAHPLLAINGVLFHLGAWSEQQLAYHLTNLQQDVPYRLPTNALPSIAAHLLIGAALAFLGARQSHQKKLEAPADPAGSLQ